MNNVAENITLSDPDRLLERINQDILKGYVTTNS